MCSCCIVNAIFTVTNAVLFPLHTLSLLLICLLCICKYVSIFYCSFSVFLMFPSRSRGFLRKAEKLLLPWSYLTSSQRLRLNLLPSTSPPSVPPLPSPTLTHKHSDVYSFLTSRHRPSLLRSGHANNQWRVCRFYKDATTRLSGVHESYFKLSKNTVFHIRVGKSGIQISYLEKGRISAGRHSLVSVLHPQFICRH